MIFQLVVVWPQNKLVFHRFWWKWHFTSKRDAFVEEKFPAKYFDFQNEQ